MSLINGAGRTRITISGHYRITLQGETAQGLVLSFQPEGVSKDLASGTQWKRDWKDRLYRVQLKINWSHLLTQTMVETWTGSAWGTATANDTALALLLIYEYGMKAPITVEPRLDFAFSFDAQPDPEEPLEISDVKGICHIDGAITLISSTVHAMPANWVTS